MFDQEADKAFMSTEWSTVNTERGLASSIFVDIFKFEAACLSKVYLVCGKGEFTTNCTPDLYINLWPIESSFVGNCLLYTSDAADE